MRWLKDTRTLHFKLCNRWMALCFDKWFRPRPVWTVAAHAYEIALPGFVLSVFR